MTLIISLLSRRVIAHASDTRHSYVDPKTLKPVRRPEDKKVKSIVILGDQACFLVSYCGRGEIGSVTTDIWLTNKMTDFGSGQRRIGETIKYLEAELKKLTDVKQQHHKLSVLFSGIEIAGDKGGISQYVLSNFEKNVNGKLVQGDISEYVVHYLRPNHTSNSPVFLAMLLGTEPATENKLFNSRMKKTIKLLKTWRPSKNQELSRALSQLIKIAASDSKYGQYISESCIVTIIPINSFEPEAMYYADPDHSEGIAPHLIGPHISFREVTYTGGDDLTLHTY